MMHGNRWWDVGVMLLLLVVGLAEGKYLKEHIQTYELDVGMEALSEEVVIQQTARKTMVAWTEWNANAIKEHIHITPVNPKTWARAGPDIVIQDAGDLDYFLLHEDGSFVLMVHDVDTSEDDRGHLYIQKHDASGSRLWREKIFPHADSGIVGEGSYSSAQHSMAYAPGAVEGKDAYVVYFRRKMAKPGSDGVRHEMDAKLWIDASNGNRLKDLGQQCSHSLALDLNLHPDHSRGYLSFCLGDAYPKGIQVSHTTFDGSKSGWSSPTIAANGGGKSRGAVSNLLRYDDKWMMVAGACRSTGAEWNDCQENDLQALVFELDKDGKIQNTVSKWLEQNEARTNLRANGVYHNAAIKISRYDDRDVLAVWSDMKPNGEDRRHYIGLLDYNMKWVAKGEDFTDLAVPPPDAGGNGKWMQRLSDGSVAWATMWDDAKNVPQHSTKVKIVVVTPTDFTCQADNNPCYDKSLCEFRFGKVECHCPPGFRGDGKECTDFRCNSHKDNCGTDAICEDVSDDPAHSVQSGFLCKCPTGWMGDPAVQCYPVTPSNAKSTLFTFGNYVTDLLHYGPKDKELKPTDAAVMKAGGLGALTPSEGEDTFSDGVTWQTLASTPNVCSVGFPYWYSGVFYLSVFTPIDQQVKLLLGHRLSQLRVWVSGTEVYTMPDGEKNVYNDHVVKVKLTRGWHNVMVYIYKSGHPCDLKIGFDTDTSSLKGKSLLAVATQKPTVNECSASDPMHDCADASYCKDDAVGFHCECPSGFAGNPREECFKIEGDSFAKHLTADGCVKDVLRFHSAGYFAKQYPLVDSIDKEKLLYPVVDKDGFSQWSQDLGDVGNDGDGDGHSDLYSFAIYAPANTKVSLTASWVGYFFSYVRVLRGSSVVFNEEMKSGSKGTTNTLTKSITFSQGWNRVLMAYKTSNGGKFKLCFGEEAQKFGYAMSMAAPAGGAAEDSEATGTGNGSGTAAIVAGVVGSVVGVGLLAGIVFAVVKRRGSSKSTVGQDATSKYEVMGDTETGGGQEEML